MSDQKTSVANAGARSLSLLERLTATARYAGNFPPVCDLRRDEARAILGLMEAVQNLETADNVGEPWQRAECYNAVFHALGRIYDTQADVSSATEESQS